MDNNLKKPNSSILVPGMSLTLIGISLIGIIVETVINKNQVGFSFLLGFLVSLIFILSIFSIKLLKWRKLFNIIILILWVIFFIDSIFLGFS